ncbi:MAG TPA: tRNA-dihydrouridine synthase [Candidatus Lokiarchaeia archaeon]
MKLGSLTLKNNLILAPMLNVTTGPYRRFCRKFFDVGLVCVPMLYPKAIVKIPKSIELELHKIEEERPISVQLIGSDKETLRNAIDFLESYNFDVLDINAGCPSKRAIKSEQGGYLLKNLEILKEILYVSVKHSSKPISLKTRIGFDQKLDISEFIKVVNDSGIDFLTVHARTVKSRSNVNALDLEFLKKLKESISIPLVGNGDINNPKFAKYYLDYTNVDALMIGRGSMGNPEIFYQVQEHVLKSKLIDFENNLNQMKNHIELYEKSIENFIEEFKLQYSLEDYKYVELKRNSIWLTKNIKTSTSLRRLISNAKDLKDLKNILNEIYKG